MYEVFIIDNAVEYQKKMASLQKEHWHIQLLQFTVNEGKGSWVVTAFKDDAEQKKPQVQ